MKLLSMIKVVFIFAICGLLASHAYAKDNDIETRGFITAISASSVTVNGVTYLLNAGTEYEDENENPLTLSDFMVGDLVKAKGPRISGDLVADELEKEDDLGGGGSNGGESGTSDRIIVRGVITSISSSEIVVGDATFLLNDQTEYEGENDQPAMHSDFTPGDIVKVKGFRNQDGNLVAREVEAEDDLNEDGEDDDSKKGDKGEIRLHCTLPHLRAIQDGLERSIGQSLKEADARVNVKVKARVKSRDDSQNVAPPEAAQGLTVLVNTTGDGPLISLTGQAELLTCNALLSIRIRIRGFNPITGEQIRQEFTQEIPVTGVYAERERRKGRKG